jgi:hypothetical protein
MELNPQNLNAGTFAGLFTAALPAASMYGYNAGAQSRLPSDSTFFSNEMMASPQGPQAGFDGLASFTSAWGLNPSVASASPYGLFGGSTLPSGLEAVYQQALTSALMNVMACFLGEMQGLNGLNNEQNANALGGLGNDTGGLGGQNDGQNDGLNGALGADKTDLNIPKGGTLSGQQLKEVLQQAGFKGEGLKTAWAIAMRESGGKPSAFNGNAGTGDKSYGLFQINMLGSLGPARLKELGLNSNEDLLDPLTNAKAAFKMSKGGTDFGAWAVGPNAYRRSAALDAAIEKYLKQFPG